MSTTPSFAWDPSLTGLRGLAIALVVAMHLGLPLPYGGPVGVTAFFVLSGYLITTLLIGERQATGTIDLRSFTLRRARRLLPALTACGFVVGIVVSASGSSAIWRDTLLAFSYLSNWARAGGDLVGMWNHAWSLAIEGQFYLVWPPVFLLLSRRWRPSGRRWAMALAAAALGSAAWRTGLGIAGVSADRLYFGTDTRAEALLAGCALAFLLRDRPPVGLPHVAGPLAAAILLVLSIMGPIDRPWDSAIYSAASIATCVLIASIRGSRRTWGLAARPMVWLGDRSYSLYLWHVPVQLVVVALTGPAPTASAMGMSLAISLSLATLSYAYIERPFSAHRRRAQPAQAAVPAIDDALATAPPTMVPARPS